MFAFKKRLGNAEAKPIKKNKKFIVGMSTAVLSSAMMVVPTFAAEAPATHYVNVTGVDFMAVLNEMVALTPVLLPVLIGCVAFRKGLSFIFSMIRGA